MGGGICKFNEKENHELILFKINCLVFHQKTNTQTKFGWFDEKIKWFSQNKLLMKQARKWKSKWMKQISASTHLSIPKIFYRKVFEMTKPTFDFNETKSSAQDFNNTQSVLQEKAQKLELEPRYLKPSTRRSKSATIRLTASTTWSQHLIPESIKLKHCFQKGINQMYIHIYTFS